MTAVDATKRNLRQRLNYFLKKYGIVQEELPGGGKGYFLTTGNEFDQMLFGSLAPRKSPIFLGKDQRKAVVALQGMTYLTLGAIPGGKDMGKDLSDMSKEDAANFLYSVGMMGWLIQEKAITHFHGMEYWEMTGQQLRELILRGRTAEEEQAVIDHYMYLR
jgi:hypothetical protein